jgi:hypothetical protein
MLTKRVWKKTAKGEEEISSRTYGLAPNLRRILILIDGVSDETKIMQKGLILPGDIKSSLQELARQEYIEAEKVLTIADIKNEMIRIAQETLGADAEKVIEKIRETPDDKESLVATVNRCKKIVKMIIDEKKADILMQQCSAILSELP